jgi:CheY-like chemotaxis protein
MAHVPSVAQDERTVRPLSTAARKLAVVGRSCAACGSTDIRPSNRRNALDILLACLFLAPFRCRVCRERFYRVWRPSLQRPHNPPSAPLLVVPPPRSILKTSSVLKLNAVEPRSVEPDPVQSQNVPPDPLPPEMKGDMIASTSNGTSGSNRTSEPNGSSEVGAVPGLATSIPAVPGAILILESDFSIRKLLCRLLERRGYPTVEIAKAEDLAGALRKLPADLVVMDVSIAGANGMKALLALARVHPHLKILALSAEPMEASDIPGRLMALPKPFPLDSFVDCVDRLLERSSPPHNAP